MLQHHVRNGEQKASDCSTGNCPSDLVNVPDAFTPILLELERLERDLADYAHFAPTENFLAEKDQLERQAERRLTQVWLGVYWMSWVIGQYVGADMRPEALVQFSFKPLTGLALLTLLTAGAVDAMVGLRIGVSGERGQGLVRKCSVEAQQDRRVSGTNKGVGGRWVLV